MALAGLAFGVWQSSAALRNAQIAAANAYVARVKSLQARTSARVAFNGVDDLMTNVAAVDLADIPQMAPVRILLLDKARAAYERLRARMPTGMTPSCFGSRPEPRAVSATSRRCWASSGTRRHPIAMRSAGYNRWPSSIRQAPGRRAMH